MRSNGVFLRETRGSLKLNVIQNGIRQELDIALDGSRRFNLVKFNEAPANQVYYSAVWESDCILCLVGVWVQTCNTIMNRFYFTETGCNIISTMPQGGLDDLTKEAVFCVS